MKSSTLLLLFTFLLLLSACSESSQNESKKSLNAEDNSKSNASEMANKDLPINFYKRFSGTIGTYPITLEFIKMDSIISGSYYYNKVKSPIVIKGKYISSDKIDFIEYTDNVITGFFSGELIVDSTFTGTWTNKKTKKSLEFNLKELESEILNFKQILTHKEKCHLADETRNEYEGTVNEAETSCSTIDLIQLEVTTKNPEIGKKINATINEEICDSYGETSSSLKEWFAMLNETDFESGFTLEVNCSVKSIYKNILCIEVTSYSYSQGAAHPNSYTEYINFNLETGKKIKYEDIIERTAIQTLSQAVENMFEKSYSEDDGWDYEKGNFPLSRNFILQSNGIFFFYNSYEIGSYAQGSQSLVIPYNKIRSLIRPTWLNIFYR